MARLIKDSDIVYSSNWEMKWEKHPNLIPHDRCNLIRAELCATNCITQIISEAGMPDDKQPFLVKEKDSNTTILQFYKFGLLTEHSLV